MQYKGNILMETFNKEFFFKKAKFLIKWRLNVYLSGRLENFYSGLEEG